MEWQTVVGTIFGIFLIFCIPIMILVVVTIITKTYSLLFWLHINHKFIFSFTIFVLLYSVLILIMR